MKAVEKECSEDKRGSKRVVPEAKHKGGFEKEGGITCARPRCCRVEKEGEEDCKLAPGCGHQKFLAVQKAAVRGGGPDGSKVRRMGGGRRCRQGAQTPLSHSTIRGEEKPGDHWWGVGGVKEFINFKLGMIWHVCMLMGLRQHLLEGFLFPGKVLFTLSCFSLITRTLSLPSLLSSYFLERKRVSEWIPRAREWTSRRRWRRSWAPRGEIFTCPDGLSFLHHGRASQHPGESRAKSSPVPG